MPSPPPPNPQEVGQAACPRARTTPSCKPVAEPTPAKSLRVPGAPLCQVRFGSLFTWWRCSSTVLQARFPGARSRHEGGSDPAYIHPQEAVGDWACHASLLRKRSADPDANPRHRRRRGAGGATSTASQRKKPSHYSRCARPAESPDQRRAAPRHTIARPARPWKVGRRAATFHVREHAAAIPRRIRRRSQDRPPPSQLPGRAPGTGEQRPLLGGSSHRLEVDQEAFRPNRLSWIATSTASPSSFRRSDPRHRPSLPPHEPKSFLGEGRSRSSGPRPWFADGLVPLKRLLTTEASFPSMNTRVKVVVIKIIVFNRIETTAGTPADAGDTDDPPAECEDGAFPVVGKTPDRVTDDTTRDDLRRDRSPACPTPRWSGGQTPRIELLSRMES